MWDFHNHYTDINAFKYTDELLPQNMSIPYDIYLVRRSEVGLDKRFHSKISIDTQVQELKKILNYAKINQIPVSLHCVKATSLMVECLQTVKMQPKKVVWHGFNGSKETASILYKLGIILSIGPKYTTNLKEIYDKNPLLVLESDYTGTNQQEYLAILTEHFTRCSSELGIEIKDLEKHCYALKKTFEN